MPNNVQINTEYNSVNPQYTTYNVTIIDNDSPTLEIREQVASVITVNVPGVQGPKGEAGEGIDTGSLVNTSSFNAFTASYNTGSFSGTFNGPSSGVSGGVVDYFPVWNSTTTFTTSSITFISGTVQINNPVVDDHTLSISGSVKIEGTFDITGSFVQGYAGNLASGPNAHAEGQLTVASGAGSHAEGSLTTTKGVGAHAEGYLATAHGVYAHAEGYLTVASGAYSHAEGTQTIARALGSHAEGRGTIASGSYQHVEGDYNTHGNTTSLLIIGNGSSDLNRSDLALFNQDSIVFSSSLEVTGGITGSLLGSASYALTASYALNGGGTGANVTGSQYFIPVFTSNTALSASLIYQSASYTAINYTGSPEDPNNPDLLYIHGVGVDTFNLLSAHSDRNGYVQLNVQNYNNSTDASSDIVATADNGTEGSGYIDMGINSSGFTNTGSVGSQNDAYLYSTGNDLYIGNASVGKQVIIFNGGLDAVNKARVFIHDQGTVGINTSTYNVVNPPSLQVEATDPNTYNLVQAAGEVDNYLQIAMTNRSGGTTASADIVVYNDIDPTNQLAGFLDMGINSSNYVNNGIYPGTAGDAYLFTDSHHLLLGTVSGSGAARVSIFAGGINEADNAKLILYGNNQHVMTGSLTATQGFSGSLYGTSSWALNTLTASYFSGSVSSATSASYALSSSFAITASYFSGSIANAVNAQTASYITSSNVYGPHGSNSILTSSFALTASYALNAGTSIDTGSFVTTSSFNSFTASYNTGSFNGSFTGSLFGTSSWASNVVSASYALTASYSNTSITASYVVLAQTASYVIQAQSASYASTASFVQSAQTASYVQTAQTASYVILAQSASYVLQAVSSSYSTTSSFSLNTTSASYTTTASFASNGYYTAAKQIPASSIQDVVNFATGSTTAGFFDYTLSSGSNARAGTVVGVWNGANVSYMDNSTVDIGSTSGVVLSIQRLAGSIYFMVTTPATPWDVKISYRLL